MTRPILTTQICYVTHDLDKAIAEWADAFNAGPFFITLVPTDFGQRTYRGTPAKDSFRAALGFCGATMIEFIQPLNDTPSVFREVLDAGGNMAVHHIMPNIRPLTPADYDSLHATYLGKGYDPALEMNLPGMGRCTMFDARKVAGSFVELMEISEPAYAGMEAMRSAHANWDGTRPIREYTEAL